MEKKKKFYLKDSLLNKEVILYLSNQLKQIYPTFDSENFEVNTLKKFPELELKERIYWIRENIKICIPESFSNTVKIFIKSLNNATRKEDFIYSVFPDYVSEYGCTKEHLYFSLNALSKFTEYFSSEFAIRAFLNKFPEETYIKFLEWSKSKNLHIRRFASEGLRQKLPWAKAINFDYKRASDILNNLFYDQERYVTRSVANHLNDISKMDSEFVLNILKLWKDSKKQSDSEMKYIIQHSLRTLIKKGDENTLKFLGFKNTPNIKLNTLTIKNIDLQLGEYLEFNFKIKAEENVKLIIDFKIIYPTKNIRISEKVFKIKNVTLSKNESLKIEKRYQFREMTTKRHYSGTHQLQIQINGKIYGTTTFNLSI